MQKLPENTEEKGWRMRIEKESSWQNKESRSFSAVTSELTTLKPFLLLVEGPTCPFFMRHAG